MHDVDLASAAKLIGRRALAAGELARIAGVSPATASSHLGQLTDGQLVTTIAQGRHRYYAIASPEVAHGLETLASISAAQPINSLKLSNAAAALRPARLCYDHIAGELGVRIYDQIAAINGLDITADGARLTEAGIAWFAQLGVDSTVASTSRRPAVRLCLDWTERRHHLAGAVPAALANHMLQRDWVRRRQPGERGLDITAIGTTQLAALLG
jgi:DNA-binding transcriptional ArsR family regulator